MTQLYGPDISIKSEAEFDALDHVPLAKRRRLLLSSRQGRREFPVVSSETKRTAFRPKVDTVVKMEDGDCDNQGFSSSPSVVSVRSQIDRRLAQERSQDSKLLGGVISQVGDSKGLIGSGEVGPCLLDTTCGHDICVPGNRNCQGSLVDICICSEQTTNSEDKADADRLEQVDGSVHLLSQNPVLADVADKVKVEYYLEDDRLSSSGDGTNGSADVDVPATNIKNDIPTKFADDYLDHIVFKERQRMLPRRKSFRSGTPVLKGLAVDCAGSLKEKIQPVDGESSVAQDQSSGIHERNASTLSRSLANVSSNGTVTGLSATANQKSHAAGFCIRAEVTKTRNAIERSEHNWSSERTTEEFNSCAVPDSLPEHVNTMRCTSLQTSLNVKVEPVECNESSGMQSLDKNSSDNLSFNRAQVKSELEASYELPGDKIDHMTLYDRMKLQTSIKGSEWITSDNSECLRKILPSSLEYSPLMSGSTKPVRFSRPRKRRKTATDSVETALQEDAPGLLQVLVEKGISPKEMKLYEDTDCDDSLDESLIEESFSELEAVMSKLFFRRTSLKFASIKSMKGSKPSYCLASLFSLVEQARYLQFRKWPVEWGWCRDLQSFIFVFERHKRLVLERPEYGYATYFFELVDSSSIDWQIKRLVTAMKLTSCGRIALLENKPLLVGRDLSEGEARVLMEYGWLPNTGLGTMLNFRDRVYHDKKNDMEISEWRSKIVQLLMDGYNDGTIVSTCIADINVDCKDTDSSPIKLEP